MSHFLHYFKILADFDEFEEPLTVDFATVIDTFNKFPINELHAALDGEKLFTRATRHLIECINRLDEASGKKKIEESAELTDAFHYLIEVHALYRKLANEKNYSKQDVVEKDWLQRFDFVLNARDWHEQVTSMIETSKKEADADHAALNWDNNEKLVHYGIRNMEYFGINNWMIPFSLRDILFGNDAYYALAENVKLTRNLLSLVKVDVEPQAIPFDRIPALGQYKGQTPIFAAAFAGNDIFIKTAVQRRHPDCFASVAFGPYEGMTPLAIALFKGHKEVARLLTKHALSTKKKKLYSPHTGVLSGLTTLEIAIITDNDLISEMLLNDYVEPKEISREDHAAYFKGLIELAKKYNTTCVPLIVRKAKQLQLVLNIAEFENKKVKVEKKVKRKYTLAEKEELILQQVAVEPQIVEKSILTNSEDANIRQDVGNFLLHMRVALRNACGTVKEEGDHLYEQLAEDLDANDELTAFKDRFEDYKKHFAQIKKNIKGQLTKSEDDDEPLQDCLDDSEGLSESSEESTATQSLEVESSTSSESSANKEIKPEKPEKQPLPALTGEYSVYQKHPPVKIKKLKLFKPIKAVLQPVALPKPVCHLSKPSQSILANTLPHFAKLKEAYKKLNQATDASSFNQHLLVSAIEGELLHIYESLKLYEQNAADPNAVNDRMIFSKNYIVRNLRDVAKYCYAQFIYADPVEFRELIKFTLDVVYPCVNHLLTNQFFVKITPSISLHERLLAMKKKENEITDPDLITARFKTAMNFMNSALQYVDKMRQFGLVDMMTLTHAELSSMAQLGVMAKAMMQWQHGETRLCYRPELMAILEADSPKWQQNPYPTPLLDVLIRVYRDDALKLKVEELIQSFNAEEMVSLLIELCNMKSHRVQDVWLEVNPMTMKLTQMLVKQLVKLQNDMGEKPMIAITDTNAKEKNEARDLLKQLVALPMLARTRATPFYQRLHQLLLDVNRKRKIEYYSDAHDIVKNQGKLFAEFSNKYLITIESVALFGKIKAYIDGVVGNPVLDKVHESRVALRNC